MSESLHSKEPWVALGAAGCLHSIETVSQEDRIAKNLTAANANRIVACVNAMAGIPACDLWRVRKVWDAAEKLRAN